MTIKKIVTTIKSCKECPHSTNSSIEHNDPFTSTPHPTRWWCKSEKHDSFGYHMILVDPDKIYQYCKEYV